MKISMAADGLETISFKRQSNTLVPISRVPPEVLCIIFLLVKSTSGAENEYGRKPLDWVKLTHVCHWWREVGLLTPFLWNVIDIDYPRWADEMLTRSKENPLTVTADLSSKKDKSFQTLQRTLRHISRIRELNLGGVSRRNLLDMFDPSALRQELPLHTLRLVSNLKADELNTIVFPDTLGNFGSQLTSLRRLALTSFAFNWNACHALRHLTHLRLCNLPYDLPCYAIDTFLEALQEMSALVMLDYEKYTPTGFKESDSTLSNARKIPSFPLPHLKYIRLALESHPLSIILSAIRLPFDVVIDLFGYDETSSTSALLILPTLSAHLQPSNAAHRKILTLAFDAYDFSECKVQSWSTNLSQKDIWTSCILPSMAAIFSWDQWDEDSNLAFLHGLFNYMRLDCLVTLSLSPTLPLGAATWATTFGALPALEFLDIAGDNTPGVFEALTYPISTESSKRFPSLHSISITGLEFETASPLEDCMIEALIERYELGLEISELIFKDCLYFPNGQFNLFRQIVVNVEIVVEDPFAPVSCPETELHPLFGDSVGPMVDPLHFWS
ncbi:hypothetical protein GALMADRAFT_518592 [Galerina marginata CBS 339.88]|uniref:Uncharacterized protein n=1 Tax=Galerina marginata (strain CBS 339.88) TaxID=685588 RepID=A0A067T505_GALM3|nr:hypothetical protein GALMADRAFT_518592 [Galerina marginata CBS 339.88]